MDENDLVSKDIVDTSNLDVTKDIIQDILEPFEIKIEDFISIIFYNYQDKMKDTHSSITLNSRTMVQGRSLNDSATSVY